MILWSLMHSTKNVLTPLTLKDQAMTSLKDTINRVTRALGDSDKNKAQVVSLPSSFSFVFSLCCWFLFLLIDLSFFMNGLWKCFLGLFVLIVAWMAGERIKGDIEHHFFTKANADRDILSMSDIADLSKPVFEEILANSGWQKRRQNVDLVTRSLEDLFQESFGKNLEFVSVEDLGFEHEHSGAHLCHVKLGVNRKIKYNAASGTREMFVSSAFPVVFMRQNVVDESAKIIAIQSIMSSNGEFLTTSPRNVRSIFDTSRFAWADKDKSALNYHDSTKGNAFRFERISNDRIQEAKWLSPGRQAQLDDLVKGWLTQEGELRLHAHSFSDILEHEALMDLHSDEPCHYNLTSSEQVPQTPVFFHSTPFISGPYGFIPLFFNPFDIKGFYFKFAQELYYNADSASAASTAFDAYQGGLKSMIEYAEKSFKS